MFWFLFVLEPIKKITSSIAIPSVPHLSISFRGMKLFIFRHLVAL